MFVENVYILQRLAADGVLRGYHETCVNLRASRPSTRSRYYLTALLKCCSNQDSDLERRTSLYSEDRGPSVRIPPRGLIFTASG